MRRKLVTTVSVNLCVNSITASIVSWIDPDEQLILVSIVTDERIRQPSNCLLVTRAISVEVPVELTLVYFISVEINLQN